MRRNLIGVLVILGVGIVFLVVRLGGRHEARTTLDQTLANLPPGYTATHGATDYDPITDTLSIRDLAVSHDGRKFATTDKLVVSDSHPQALQAVFDPAAYPDGRPAWTDRRALLGHVEITGLTVIPAAPDAPPVTVKHLVLDGLAGRPFIRPPTAANRSAPDFQTDVAQALAVKTLTIEGLGLSQSGHGHLSIAFETLTDYDGGKLGGFTIGSVDASATDPKQSVSFSLAKFALGGVDATESLKTLAGAGSLDPVARRRLAISAYTQLKLASGDLDGLAMKISPGPRFEIASEHGAMSLQSEGTKLTTASVKGFLIAAGDTALPPSVHETLTRFGTDQIVIDSSGTTSLNPATHHLEFRQVDMTLRGLGTLHLAGAIGGYDQAAMRSGDPKANLAAMMNWTIEHLAIEWDDAGLTDRIIGLVAAQQGSTADQVKATATMPLAALSVMIPDQPDAAAQITAFIDHPQSLRITLDPPAPVPLSQIAGLPMPARAHALGLKIDGK